ncbi:entericidin A/B family lipoprotein [Pseudoroseicyclus aestuarii]|uniref:Putative small secreted protein n=1 Tax=Pseudoroseicyclus aestuarii TaxID=1795041 RepID=A0A318SU58_9RHOB|nr:entericidin A/B family lipoprotein [Pseudoroseicyclus aestuarii]PYE85420.1 putative small secreted protein [Pseudoroseicyclus aestuarii]
MARIITVLFGLTLLAACETVEGAGQDISSAGNAISQESREVQGGY